MTEENFLDFISNLQNQNLAQYLIENELSYDKLCCIYCHNDMELKDFYKSELGLNWRCTNSCCTHYETTLSLFHNSFHHNSSISVVKHLKIIYYLIKKVKQQSISEFVGVDRKTIGNIKKKIVLLIKKYFEDNPIRLGGIGKTVQVDETKLNYNVKSHRGRGPEAPDWALTMVDISTTPARGFAKMISDRSAETLISNIEQVVRPRTHIQTDEWAGYRPLSQMNIFSHSTITHKYNFVDPITGVHTQQVESFNNKIKTDIKTQRGVRKNLRENFLSFFSFLDTFKDNAFEKILLLLKIS